MALHDRQRAGDAEVLLLEVAVEEDGDNEERDHDRDHPRAFVQTHDPENRDLLDHRTLAQSRKRPCHAARRLPVRSACTPPGSSQPWETALLRYRC
eukprot:1829896-Rhodomonas_salina.4